MSCPATETTESTTPQRRPTHNWRPTLVQGAVLWLVLAVALVAPLGGPADLGVALVGVFTAPVFPVALVCDYRQARAYGDCPPGVGSYVRNLARDLATTVGRGESLGSARGRAGEC